MNSYLPSRYYFSIGGIVALLCLSMASAFAADPISGYGDSLAALQSEKVVKVLVDLDRCGTAGTGKSDPPVKGGLAINAFNVVPGKGILFSDMHPTLNSSEKPVTEYIRYDFSEDNKRTLTVTHTPFSRAV